MALLSEEGLAYEVKVEVDDQTRLLVQPGGMDESYFPPSCTSKPSG